MWPDHQADGYASTIRFTFAAEFEQCLITGGYGGDDWTPRSDVPHHNDFAIGQPDSALVHAPKIQRRSDPFAFPGEWKLQYDLRYRLAIEHVKAAVGRARDGDTSPFLGAGNAIPAALLPPTWAVGGTEVASAKPIPTRGTDGWLVTA